MQRNSEGEDHHNQCFGIDVFWSNWQFQLLCESQIPNPIPITFQILLNYNLKVIPANELKFFGKVLTLNFISGSFCLSMFPFTLTFKHTKGETRVSTGIDNAR